MFDQTKNTKGQYYDILLCAATTETTINKNRLLQVASADFMLSLRSPQILFFVVVVVVVVVVV
jgi:hypothetical protein